MSTRASTLLVLFYNSSEMFSAHFISFLSGHVGAELDVINNSEDALFQQIEHWLTAIKNSLIRML